MGTVVFFFAPAVSLLFPCLVCVPSFLFSCLNSFVSYSGQEGGSGGFGVRPSLFSNSALLANDLCPWDDPLFAFPCGDHEGGWLRCWCRPTLKDLLFFTRCTDVFFLCCCGAFPAGPPCPPFTFCYFPLVVPMMGCAFVASVLLHWCRSPFPRGCPKPRFLYVFFK